MTLRFFLSKPALVEFLLVRVAPDCRPVARFLVKGRAGTNRVRFRGRIRGRALRPGTYVIRARTLPAGKALAETKLVIFKRKPLPRELAAAQAANACGISDRAEGMSSARALPGGTKPTGGADKSKLEVSRGNRGKTPLGVLGVRFTRAADAVKDVPALVFVLLGIAIGLLAAAAMPLRFLPDGRLAALLAYQRTSVALAGAITLASVALVYALA
jgi:hypothetical protein